MDNKKNLQFFEANSKKSLFNNMQDWQVKNEKRLLSTDIQRDGDIFTCIALTNPSEVVLCDSEGKYLSTALSDNEWGSSPLLGVATYNT